MKFDVTGDWLAGFIDGEGSFNIAHHGGNYQPRFELKLRDDDIQIIVAIKQFVGVGTTHRRIQNPREKYYTANHRNQIKYVIVGSDNIDLIRLLEKFPLRSKKMRDFLIWKKAVEIYSGNLFHRWSNPLLKQQRHMSLRALKFALEEIRKYQS